jgi:hypothetical protein
MLKSTFFLYGALLLTAGCGQQEEDNAAANTSTNTAAAPEPRHYCFFKKDEQKDWTASRGADGNITVKGRVHVSDPRYKGDLGQPEISGNSVKLWLTMAQVTGYRSVDNWWDVSFTIASSAAVENVTVACDSKPVFAELTVKPRK